MARYSAERKEAVLRKMLPPMSLSVAEISREEGISDRTLYAWRRALKMEGIAVLRVVKNADEWPAESRLAVVIETAGMSEIDLSQYCRKKGLYVEQVRAWYQAALEGQSVAQESRQVERQRVRREGKQIKLLEKELARKDKALAETAALLVLSKKLEAIWGNKEED